MNQFHAATVKPGVCFAGWAAELHHEELLVTATTAAAAMPPQVSEGHQSQSIRGPTLFLCPDVMKHNTSCRPTAWWRSKLWAMQLDCQQVSVCCRVTDLSPPLPSRWRHLPAPAQPVFGDRWLPAQVSWLSDVVVITRRPIMYCHGRVSSLQWNLVLGENLRTLAQVPVRTIHSNLTEDLEHLL